MNKIINAVVDTNIFINGLFFSSKYENCAKILDYIDDGKIRPMFSQETIGELVYLVKNFARYNLDTEIERIAYLNGIMDLFYYGHSVNTENTLCPNIKDKNDIMFLKIAYEKPIDFIITNDKKSGLFEIENQNVVTANEFINELNVKRQVASE